MELTGDPVSGLSANFYSNPTSGCKPLPVNFTDQSSGNPTSWAWNFGDGGTSNQQNPSHTFSNAGSYTVTLTVSNQCGSDSETKTNYITVYCAPVANFNGSPTNGCSPLTVQFNDQSTCNPTSWNWNFGDGGTSNQQNPSHTFSNAGSYTVTLTVSNQCGSDSEIKINYITVLCVPIADFDCPPGGTYPLAVDFLDLSTGNPTSWNWDFGDGESSSQQNPSHTYSIPGSFTVTLTVSNACGSDTKTIIGCVNVITTINEPNQQMDLNIYPNPTRDKIFISLNSNIERIDKVELINEMGALTLQQSNLKNTDPIEINVGDLQNGLYILSIHLRDAILREKVIIKHN
jgi:PKD repeat protein